MSLRSSLASVLPVFRSDGSTSALRFVRFISTTRSIFGSSTRVDTTVELGTAEAKPKKRRTPPKNRMKPPLPDLIESDLQISFVRGSGPGGQVINKSSISCSIIHVPSGLRVQCHQTRSQLQNKVLAMRILQGKLDQLYNPGTSQAEQKWEREGKKKASRDRKRKRKLAGVGETLTTEGEDDGDDYEGDEDINLEDENVGSDGKVTRSQIKQIERVPI